MAVALAILVVRTIRSVLDTLIQLGPAGQQNNMIAAFAAAASVGLVMGFFANQVVHSLAMSLVQARTERLLVECWDKLASCNVDSEPSAIDPNTPACSLPS